MGIVLRTGTFRTNAAGAMGINVDITPAPIILVAELTGIARELKDFKTPLTNSVKKVMMPSISKNFQVGGRPQWAPLAAATMSRRRADGRGTSGRPLIATQRLRRRASAFKIWTIHGKSGEAYVASLGGDLWYGNIHQEGYEGNGDGVGYVVRNGRRLPPSRGATPREGDTVEEGYVGDIPARPFLVIQPEDADNIEKEFDDWVGKTFLTHGWPASR